MSIYALGVSVRLISFQERLMTWLTFISSRYEAEYAWLIGLAQLLGRIQEMKRRLTHVLHDLGRCWRIIHCRKVQYSSSSNCTSYVLNQVWECPRKVFFLRLWALIWRNLWAICVWQNIKSRLKPNLSGRTSKPTCGIIYGRNSRLSPGRIRAKVNMCGLCIATLTKLFFFFF